VLPGPLAYDTARYYDPSLGRFISADTIVPGAGSLTVSPNDPVAAGAWVQRSGGPSNPQQLNRYSYVLNNPVQNIDPSGHCGPAATPTPGSATSSCGSSSTSATTNVTSSDSGWNTEWVIAAGGTFIRETLTEVGRAALRNEVVRRVSSGAVTNALGNGVATLAIDGIWRHETGWELANKMLIGTGLGLFGGGAGGLIKNAALSTVVNSGVTIFGAAIIDDASAGEVAQNTVGEAVSSVMDSAFAELAGQSRIPWHIRVPLTIASEYIGGFVGEGINGFR